MNRLLLPYPISANRYWRNMNGRLVVSKEAMEYKRTAKHEAIVGRCKPLQGQVSVSLYLHPKLTTKGKASETRLDLDNCVKVALDSMNGIAYADDKQITRLFAEIGEPMQGGGLTVLWENV